MQTIKQADDGGRLDYFNAHNTTCTTLGPAQGAEHNCLPEQVIRDSHNPPRRAQALLPDPPADSGTGRFEVRASSTTLGALGCISIYIRGMHNCAEFKEPPASLKATLTPEEQLNICDVFLGLGLYPGDALLGLGWCPSRCLFSEDEAIDINLSKAQMIGPRTRLNLRGPRDTPQCGGANTPAMAGSAAGGNCCCLGGRKLSQCRSLVQTACG